LYLLLMRPTEISMLVILFINPLYISMEKEYFFSNSKYLFSKSVTFLLKVAFYKRISV